MGGFSGAGCWKWKARVPRECAECLVANMGMSSICGGKVTRKVNDFESIQIWWIRTEKSHSLGSVDRGCFQFGDHL